MTNRCSSKKQTTLIGTAVTHLKYHFSQKQGKNNAMSSCSKKVITAIAWGLAFDSLAEIALAAIWGGRAGLKGGALMKKGLSPEEASATLDKEMPSWFTYLPAVAGSIGLFLGLKGLLPGTEK